MKVIVAGSRNITSRRTVADVIAASGFSITELVSGCAAGVDTVAENWARDQRIAVKRMPADWDTYGRRMAGRQRNLEMAMYADALIAVWDGHSSGTRHMIQTARRRGLKVYVGIVNS